MMICGFWLPGPTFSKSLCQYLRRGFFLYRAIFFCGLLRETDTKKVLRAFVELLADAVRYEA